MAYAHDNTLLSRLGFQDPDKKLPRHDLACRYIAQPGLLKDLFGLHVAVSARTEEVISKGQGQYRQHIGFADAVAEWGYFTCAAHADHDASHNRHWRWIENGRPGVVVEPPGPRPKKCSEIPCESGGIVLIEVKITPVPAAEILRQLNLYRQYLDVTGTLLVVDFPIVEGDKDQLLSAGIDTVRLGVSFEQWLPTQRTEAPLRSV